MHLHTAERIRACLASSSQPHHARLLALLQTDWPAFYLGSIAPDFQAICAVDRFDTHFYPIPPEPDDYDAFGRMLTQHQSLSNAAALPRTAAIATAGYGAHLLYDLIWDHSVLTPRFRNSDWGEVWERYVAHNTLLTFLDREAHAQLPLTAGKTLASAKGLEEWLPFAPNGILLSWQTLLVNQLKPGAALETVSVYAKRMRLSPEQFAAQLDDTVWMESHVFSRVNPEAVYATLDSAIGRSVELLAHYLAPLL